MSQFPQITRHDWSREEIHALMTLPFNDPLFRAQQVHRTHFDPNSVQISTLLSVKTGACPEDCKYCPQSTRYNTGLDAEALIQVEEVEQAARKAKEAGMKVCSGGILGMGEKAEDRVGLLQQLANLPTHPESVPINMLVRVAGTPLEDAENQDMDLFQRLGIEPLQYEAGSGAAPTTPAEDRSQFYKAAG